MRNLFAALLAVTTLFLTGCTDNTELGSRAIIEAAAIDCDQNGYTVSALLFSAKGSGGTIDASEENVIKVSGSGKTLAEAFDNISLIDGKEIYLSEIKLIILGGGFENREVLSTLNTLFYDMRCSLKTPVCCARKAEFLTDLHFTEGITSAEKPLDMIKNAYNKGVSPKPMLLDILCGAESGESVLIPLFEETENGYGMTTDESGKTAVLSGSRYIEAGYLSGSFGSEITAGLMLLTGEADRADVNFFYRNTEQTCEAYSIKVNLSGVGDNAQAEVTARFCGRNGAALSQQMQEAAKSALQARVEAALPYLEHSVA